MRSLDFLQGNKKALAAVGLILICISIALSACSVEENAAEQSQGSLAETSGTENLMNDPESSTTESSAETQTEQSSEQETTSTPAAEPTEESESTEEPEPVLTAEYELIYEGINVFRSGTVGTYFRYKNIYADLYMRRLQDDTGEYVELSLWSDQKRIWNTVNHDIIENYDYPLFWQEENWYFALDKRVCYYVVEIDGTVYLMRYCVETASKAVTMSYKVFGIDSFIESPDFYQGHEDPLDAGSISIYLVSDSAVATAVSFPIDEMTVFADTVKGYMENGHLVASTLHGVFEFGVSADRDNPVSPYLYDIFPWIPELVTTYSVNTEGIHSPKKMLAALQNILPTDDSVTMPDVTADGKYFITGDYYKDENFLTVRMKEDGSYGGTLLINRWIYMDYAGYYDNGILTTAEITDYRDSPFETEISFKNGKATVTITAAPEGSGVKVGDTFTSDRNEKPKQFEYLKHVEEIPRE